MRDTEKKRNDNDSNGFQSHDGKRGRKGFGNPLSLRGIALTEEEGSLRRRTESSALTGEGKQKACAKRGGRGKREC